MSETNFNVDGKTLTVERTIAAPRSAIWKAWTTPELFAQWWGPRGWNTTVKHMDFVPGGYLLYGMTCADEAQGDWYGKTSWGKSVYRDINPEETFTYTDYFCDENGMVDEQMPSMTVHMFFEEKDGATHIKSTSDFASEAALQQVIEMGMEEGLKQTWDRLEEMVTEA